MFSCTKDLEHMTTKYLADPIDHLLKKHQFLYSFFSQSIFLYHLLYIYLFFL